MPSRTTSIGAKLPGCNSPIARLTCATWVKKLSSCSCGPIHEPNQEPSLAATLIRWVILKEDVLKAIVVEIARPNNFVVTPRVVIVKSRRGRIIVLVEKPDL